VQLEDSATYPDEALSWPAGVDELIIQAAESHRPIIRITSVTPPGGLAYQALTVRGLAWTGVGDGAGEPGVGLSLPAAETLALEWCSMLASTDTLSLSIADGVDARIDHCLFAGITVTGSGTLTIRDSAIDSGKDSPLAALSLADAELDIERSTVIGTVEARVLEASEVLFANLVTVSDRFRGCIRYSAVPEGCVLPRHHRLVVGEPARFVSYDRLAPGHLRLSDRSPLALRFGAADGSEIGVFHDLQSERRREALLRRLDEYTPAGLTTGLVRID
jgi:hypothetical protein